MASALILAGLCGSPPAQAFEKQWRVGGGAGLATLRHAPVGPALDLHGAYGLNDMFDAQLELLWSRHGGADGTDILSASAGLSYKIDVFEWVPYVGLLGGYYHYLGAPGPDGESGPEPGASIVLGLDHLFTRNFSMGAQVRWHASFADGVAFPYFNALLRAEYRWGP